MSDTLHTIPERSAVHAADCWNLQSLYSTPDGWEAEFTRLQLLKGTIDSYRGTLGQSAESLATGLMFSREIEQLAERLGTYAFLRAAEDGGSSEHQARQARIRQLGSECDAAFAYFVPEVLAIPPETLATFAAQPVLAEWTIELERITRHRPHVLPPGEEKLLAGMGEFSHTAGTAFDALTDVDFDFGTVETPDGPRPLTHGSFGELLQHADRGVRHSAYRQFYAVFNSHRHSLATLYSGSVTLDVFGARVRHFPDSRSAALFGDNVSEEVYDALVRTVRAGLPTLHRAYKLRRRALGLPALAPYDLRAPLVPEQTWHHPYDSAVDLVLESVRPLGVEYATVLERGLRGGWVDRYENRGKASGAFSAGSYAGDPYILLNYHESVLDDVFTLAHEAGHSMHSYRSVRAQPFQYYHPRIFVAEVASTFNEELLFRHLRRATTDPQRRASLLSKRLEDLIATLYRQTMFAEFEATTHALVERGEPLTVERLRSEYRALQTAYFGAEVVLEPESDLECLRIPHFYNAFYVYKYATGVAAALALAERVIDDKFGAREAYLEFLASGDSQYPIDLLQAAGVDMTTAAPIKQAIATIAKLVDELETLLPPAA